MDNLIAFVKARLDEDEARANAMEHVTAESQLYACPATRSAPLAGTDLEWGEENCDCGLARRKGRALREVAAKRKILWDHTPKTTGRRTACSRCHYGNVLGANWPCLTMTSLAGIWSDHPDFQPEWVP